MELSADTATWVAVGVAAAAALLVFSLLLVVHGRRRAARELAQATVEEVRRYVEGALARQAEERRPTELERPDTRLRRLSEVSQTVDLDEVLERALRAASELSGAAAAMVVVDRDREPLLRTIGLSPEEVARQPLGLPPAAPEARALELDYRYTDDEAANDEFRLSRGLVVPVRAADSIVLGTITVFWRRMHRAVEEADLAFLEELGAFLVPAVENARRFLGAQAGAWLDDETGLPNRRFFEDALHRELARARRYNHSLTLLVLDPEGAGDSGVAEAAARVSAAVRASDFACRVARDELALVLPETALADAETVLKRLESFGPVRAGLAELTAEDDPASLTARAEQALTAEAA
jgi:GGDEF domain-containing protein